MNQNQSLLSKVVVTTLSAASILSVPSVTSAHFDKKPLVKGMNDESVKVLQILLKEAGYYNLNKSTGYFGTTTLNAVKSYQQDRNLIANGVVGSETKRALITDALKRTHILISQGDTGSEVKAVQKDLEDNGYYKGNLDGVYGPLTRLAVLNFQHDQHLFVDGIVGPETKAALSVYDGNGPVPLPAEDTKKKIPVKSEAAPSQRTTTHQTTTYHPKSVVKTVYMNSTGYTANCAGCSGVTATGIDLNRHPDSKIVAVDPSVIPLGSRLFIEGYGYAVAGDTGGAIKGQRIDLFFPQQSDALNWGRRTVKVTILDTAQ